MNNETPEERRMRMMEESQQRLIEQNAQLQGTLTALMSRLLVEQDRQRDNEPRREREDSNVKIDIHAFDGTLDPEKYLEWESTIESYFEFKNIEDEESKFRIAKVKLKGYGVDWLKGEQKNRTLRGKATISTWEKLKKRMRDRFIPSNYMRNQYIKWSTLQQGYGSVEEYVKEFDRLAITCEINENEELKLGRFLSGLNVELREKLDAYVNLTFHEACKIAIKLDNTKKKKKTYPKHHKKMCLPNRTTLKHPKEPLKT